MCDAPRKVHILQMHCELMNTLSRQTRQTSASCSRLVLHSRPRPSCPLSLAAVQQQNDCHILSVKHRYRKYNTRTHPFNGPFSGTTRVSRYPKGKTNLDFTEARDSEWQWHQLGHVQVCTSLQTDNHASAPPLSFIGQMPFLPPNQQRQSTDFT